MTIDFRQADWEVWWADTRNREVPPETVVNRILRMVNFVRKNKGLVLGITEWERFLLVMWTHPEEKELVNSKSDLVLDGVRLKVVWNNWDDISAMDAVANSLNVVGPGVRL